MPRSGPNRTEHGFTLVEVLVVVLLIAILASIALPLFLNQRTGAQDADAKTVAVTAAKAMEVWRTDHDSYDGATLAELRRIEPSLNRPGVSVETPTEQTYAIEVASNSGAGGGGPFRIERNEDGSTDRLCDGGGRGACTDDGTW